MRTREEIQIEYARLLDASASTAILTSTRALKMTMITVSVLVEIALDIRELLIEKEAKEKK